MTRIERIVVAVPARNEELRLPAALAAVGRAAARVAVPVTVVVAADASTDRTAEEAAAAGAVVVETAVARVGGARAAAVAGGLAAIGSDIATGRIWIANTDADSVVPADWLAVHLEHAEAGADLLRGSVRPDPEELTPRQVRRWLELNPAADLHEYVHGANLGLNGEAYLAAGGFEDVPLHEDVRLVDAVEHAGFRVVSTGRAPVRTSARLTGRAEGGFAAYLRDRVLRAPAAAEL